MATSLLPPCRASRSTKLVCVVWCGVMWCGVVCSLWTGQCIGWSVSELAVIRDPSAATDTPHYTTIYYSTSLYSTQHYFYSTILHSTLLLLHSTLLYSTPLHSTLLYTTLFHSTPLYLFCRSVYLRIRSKKNQMRSQMS